MTEVIATNLLRFIFDQVSSKALSEFVQLIGVEKELQKLERTLSTIQDVLEDAETRQVKEKALGSWLRKLKDLAYDADDVLDDFACKATKLKAEKEVGAKEKASYFLSLPKNIAFRRKMALRVKEINARLDEVAEDRWKFHLKEGAQSLMMESSMVREETGSFINESEVYGRREDKEKIVEFLVNTSNGEDIGVISIVGLGGLGKTTLAQLVYNEERVCEHFEKMMWVCVSEEFETKRLVKLIIESATGSEFSPQASTDAMQASLRKQLKGKRFLLVLDDVWSESHEKWETLRTLLTVGGKGSKVVVTTRSERVASIMGTIPPYQLPSLSSNDCRLLFERRAFANGVEKNPNLVEIGKEMVKKCGGVPLAAKALGSLLRFKRTESEWLAIRDSELWKLSNEENCEVLPALKLSYNHLSSSLKQCFAYCSILPKDYHINTDILIKLWGAEGFLKPPTEHMHWEQVGLQHVEELLARSLFQKTMEGGGVARKLVKMHDLVHDLARSVAGNECSIVDAATGKNISQDTRYMSFISDKETLSGALQSICVAKKLRTFYLDASAKTAKEEEQKVHKVVHAISSNITLLRALHLSRYPIRALPDSFKKLKHLRYLDLSNTKLEFFPSSISTLHSLQTLNFRNSNIKVIPDSIGNLCNLCTLNLSHCINLSSLPSSISRLTCLLELDISNTPLKLLPESICNLSNLQILRLRNCFFLHKLPQSISKVKSLVHLDIHGCQELTSIPSGIGKLSQLRTLPIFIPGGETGGSLVELGCLKLEVILHIKKLQKVTSIEDANAANLSNKQSIKSLKLSWELNSYRNSKQTNECDRDKDEDELAEWKVKVLQAEDVLQSLQPSIGLETLEIEGYVGRTFPSWMTDLSLAKLVSLALTSCNCEKIPAIGQLPKLKVLNFVSLPLIMRLDSDFYGGANAFPSLQELELNSMMGLEEWCSEEDEKLLPCLHKLTMLDCPNLKALPSNFSSVKTLIMNVDDKLLLSSLQNGGFQNLKHISMLNYDGKEPMPEVLIERANSQASWSLSTKPEPKEGDSVVTGEE